MTDNDSSDEDFPDSWKPYSQRSEWADVTPLEQDEGIDPVVNIQYSNTFNDVYGYFRAVLASREMTDRTLELTQDALRLNAANYTVWQYRRDILRELDKNLNEELAYTERVMVNNPKNYQVWHHRRVIVESMNDASNELELTERILRLDAKNYHAWQHRQWAIKAYTLFDNEMIYVDKLIASDVRNNSAWNQRFFVLQHTAVEHNTPPRLSPESMCGEIKYVTNRIQIVNDNESSWNYLRGILQLSDGCLYKHPEVIRFVEDLYINGCRSPHLLSFMIDLYEDICTKNVEEHNEQELVAKVSELCKGLEHDYDTIRSKYWKYVEQRFRARYNRSKQTSSGNVRGDSAGASSSDTPLIV